MDVELCTWRLTMELLHPAFHQAEETSDVIPVSRDTKCDQYEDFATRVGSHGDTLNQAFNLALCAIAIPCLIGMITICRNIFRQYVCYFEL